MLYTYFMPVDEGLEQRQVTFALDQARSQGSTPTTGLASTNGGETGISPQPGARMAETNAQALADEQSGIKATAFGVPESLETTLPTETPQLEPISVTAPATETPSAAVTIAPTEPASTSLPTTQTSVAERQSFWGRLFGRRKK
ncbi:MAG: hypothetical protein US62_C0025G0004 [Candidatus Woesebacteria bacterium GW2011_GWA1_37_8]|uniref:Uncharacterized protein n=2 Tax=Candidatus Woeseibacteriota TaxID=1752722 RepID=A0A0G0LGA8_9BACT|nr:MAG: hypothetical protein US62_C0025G0004 [Candidatus Woesebacteria bacterium GW2011_GWA1_37_8]KKQ86975.1 MAG: hypothetical protein UT10_C0013G0024 [Candidatus Woesebacteria bacterium GW2011_GWB1_38_8b]